MDSYPAPVPLGSDRALVRKLRRSTVVFVRLVDGKFTAFATGVWIGPKRILSVFHALNVPDSDSPNLEDAVIGSPMSFKTYSEAVSSTDSSTFPEDGHRATAVAVDRNGDLVLLESDAGLDHDFVDLAPESSQDGDFVSLVGHPRGDLYTYSVGVVSATRMQTGPFKGEPILMYQVTAPVWYGSSGGGVFNAYGELIGIVSCMDVGSRGIGWVVHDKHIRQFLFKDRTR